MFDLANRIAYAGRMVHATGVGRSTIRDQLGPSAWVDVDAPSSGKWVEAEGQLIATVIAELCRMQPKGPDLYVISPFRVPAMRLRQLLARTPNILPALSRTDQEDWIERHIGTVHTFQGKEPKPSSSCWGRDAAHVLDHGRGLAARQTYSMLPRRGRNVCSISLETTKSGGVPGRLHVRPSHFPIFHPKNGSGKKHWKLSRETRSPQA